LTAEGAGGVLRAAVGIVHPVPAAIFAIELIAGLSAPLLLLRRRRDRARAYGYAVGGAIALLAIVILITTAAHR
jgi:hypothetical protein